MTAAVPGNVAQWTSGYGFVLSALGTAVGLGNIWRFSYVAGENGGGTFVVVYALAVLLQKALAAKSAKRRQARDGSLTQ